MANVVFELLAKIGLDDKEFNNKLKQDGSSLQSWGSKAASIAGGAAKLIGAGVVAVGAATVKVGKQALESYADYEQLVGGVETLFGDSANKVVENAQGAFKTAGMSANDYMETVTSFSASLLQSLGGDTEKAADYADMAITDMSDNANKMGTSMESIQNAYQGFAKQNYTMLDNLKLGYGGTKSEMERLVEDAEGLSDTFEAQRDASGNLALSYADIVDAIHIVQENMGITGTTAKEASETISGSVSAMKAAWKNLVTGIADDNADIDTLMDNFIDSIETVGKNIIPRIKTIITNVAKLIKEGTKKILPPLLEALTDALPDLVEAGVSIITALITGLVQAIPDLIAAIPDIIRAIIEGFKKEWPNLKEAGKQALEAIALGLAEGTFYLWAAIDDALGGMITKFQEGFAHIGEVLASLWDSIKNVFSEGFTDFGDVFGGMLESVTETFDKIKKAVTDKVSQVATVLKTSLNEIYEYLTDSLRKRIEAVEEYIRKIWNKITETISNIKEKMKEGMEWLYEHTIGKLVALADGVREKLNAVRQHFQDLIDAAYNWGQDLITNFVDGFTRMFPHVGKALNAVTNKIADMLGFSEPKEGPLSNFHTYAPDMMKLFAQGIKENAHLVTDQIGKSFSSVSSIADSIPNISGSGYEATTNHTTNNYITVNGIEELQELLDWFESRQVVARMA